MYFFFSKLSHVYQCTGCKSMTLQPLGQVIERHKKPPKYSLTRVPFASGSCQHCQGSLQVGYFTIINERLLNFIEILFIYTMNVYLVPKHNVYIQITFFFFYYIKLIIRYSCQINCSDISFGHCVL